MMIKRKMKKLKKTMIILLTVIALLCATVAIFLNQPSFGRLPQGERLARIEKSPNYRNGIFVNRETTPLMTAKKRNRLSLMIDFLFHKPEGLRPDKPMKAMKTDLKHLDRNKNLLVWFGHSSYLLQVDGVRYLVDPVFYNASPLSFIMKPFEGTDIYKPDDMPDIDYLIITHDHWDHLDYKTVVRLRKRVAHVICPLGVGEDFEYWGYNKEKITEMDWENDATLGGAASIHCLPSRHFSGRGLKSNRTLWASYMLESASLNIFIGGDGGYDGRFEQIGKRFKKIDLAILENGQYNDDWRYIHTMPFYLSREAKELHATEVLTVHHSKFALARHRWDEPLHNIETMRKEGVNVIAPTIGSVVLL
jgi:L-ascorbate metabolism protein UlaG (beta-lactamase superfamily)